MDGKAKGRNVNQQLWTTTADGSYAVFTLRYFGQKLNIKCQSHRCNRNKQKAEARGGGLLARDGNVLCSTQKNTMDFIIRIIMETDEDDNEALQRPATATTT